MRDDLDTLMANLTSAERDRLTTAFAADPELADGLSTMLAELPAPPRDGSCAGSPRTSSGRTPFGGGAMRFALTDVIEDALRHDS